MPKQSQRKASARARKRVRRGNQEDAQQLREELLAAAMRLFAHGGLEAVSMRAVAAAVGVSAMTPYRYFAEKAELLSGLWQFVLRSVCQQMRRAIEAQEGARARMRASLDAFLSYYETNPDHYRLVYMTEQTTQKQTMSGLTSAPVYAELLGIVRGVLADFAREIGVEETHIRLAADIRAAMQLGYLHGTLVNLRYPWTDKSLLREVYIEEIIATVERCLLREPSRQVDLTQSTSKARIHRTKRVQASAS